VTPELRVIPGGRTLPQNLDAERLLLGAVMLRGSVLPEFEEIAADDFYLPAHRATWEAILFLAKSAHMSDPIAVADQLQRTGDLLRLEGGMDYLLRCVGEVITLENAGHSAEVVREKSNLRKAIVLAGELMARAYGDERFSDVIADHRDEVARLEAGSVTHEPVMVRDVVQPGLDQLERRASNPTGQVVTWGMAKLDRMLGGLFPENLITVAARPGMGKSALASTLVANNTKSAIPIPTIWFSPEMSRFELLERLLSGDARINNRLLRSGMVMKTDMTGQLFDSARRIHEWPVWIDDRASLSFKQLAGTLRRWYSKVLGAVPARDQPEKPALVVVDYLQIMEVEESREYSRDSRSIAIGRITRGLKQLAKALRVPIVQLSQLNREVERRTGPPNLSDLRESGAIEQDSDVVLFPWRELPSDPDEASRKKNESGPAQIVIGKNRNGPCGVADVHWLAEYTRFENAIADEPQGHWQDKPQEG
jgi:replicative DNA helicase